MSSLLLQSVLSCFGQIFTAMDYFHWSGNSSLFKAELSSLWILDRNVSPTWINSAVIWSLPGDLHFSNFEAAISTQKV
jgi:hypothetical protein